MNVEVGPRYDRSFADHQTCRSQQATYLSEKTTCDNDVAVKKSAMDAECSSSMLEDAQYTCKRSQADSQEEYLESIVKMAASATKKLAGWRIAYTQTKFEWAAHTMY